MIRRNWLQEAIEIAQGKKAHIKREHIAALASSYLDAVGRLEKIQGIMKRLMENEQKMRADLGIPSLKIPAPPSEERAP